MFGNKEVFKLDKLKEGYTFRLRKNTWTIIEIVEYDWSGDGRSIEYILRSNQDEEAFLEVEFLKGDYELYFSNTVFIEASILEEAISAKKILFKEDEFFLEEHYKGVCKNLTNMGRWENLKSYMFYNRNEDIITIEDWGNNQYMAFYGQEIKAKNIKNIISN